MKIEKLIREALKEDAKSKSIEIDKEEILRKIKMSVDIFDKTVERKN